MPQSRSEQIVAALMLGVTVTLVALILLEVRDDRPQQTARATVPTGNTDTRIGIDPPRSLEEMAKPAAVLPPVASDPQPAKKAPSTSLLLTAATGDTWLSVRTDSAQGDVLYAGILTQGRSVFFTAGTATRLWVRFGGASDVEARLDGKLLPLPAGTYSALITRDGLQRLPE